MQFYFKSERLNQDVEWIWTDMEKAYWQTWAQLAQDMPLDRDMYLECCFSLQRLTYRIGCELIRRIEVRYGVDEARKAFYLDCNRFVEAYQWLLEAHS